MSRVTPKPKFLAMFGPHRVHVEHLRDPQVARGRRRGACPRETRAHDTDTRCKRRDGAWAGNVRPRRTNPRAMGGWEVAAPFLRLGRARCIRSLCKNGGATRGRAIYTWWIIPRVCRLRRTRDGPRSCVMGGPWAKQKSEANVSRRMCFERKSCISGAAASLPRAM